MAERRRPPAILVAAAGLLACAAALPLAYLLIVVTGEAGDAFDAIWRERTARLALRSIGLAAAVTASAVTLAITLAWLTVRTDLPGRRLWTVALALPLVMPSYIGAYLFVSALGSKGLLQQALEGPLGIDRLPEFSGFWAAWLVLTLFTYPLVLLPVRAAMRHLDPSLEDAAIGMGRSRVSAFFTVVLPQLRPAAGAGAIVVALYALSEFGAVSILRFDSFTRAIYQSYTATFDRTGAAALGVLLVVLMLGVLALERRVRGRSAFHRIAPGAARPASIVPLGRWRLPAIGFCVLVVALALALPAGVLGYWSAKSIAGELEGVRLAGAVGGSLSASGLAALAATAAAVPIAYLGARYPGRTARMVERLSFTGYALPGVVIALALVFFGTRLLIGLYQTLPMLVFAFAVLFLPLALGSARAAFLQVSPRLEEAARGMGRAPAVVAATITGPLAASGVLAGAALVFLTAIKELPATLILAPIGFETLATEIWQETSVGFFERGAIPALVLLAVSAPPLYLLAAREWR